MIEEDIVTLKLQKEKNQPIINNLTITNIKQINKDYKSYLELKTKLNDIENDNESNKKWRNKIKYQLNNHKCTYNEHCKQCLYNKNINNIITLETELQLYSSKCNGLSNNIIELTNSISKFKGIVSKKQQVDEYYRIKPQYDLCINNLKLKKNNMIFIKEQIKECNCKLKNIEYLNKIIESNKKIKSQISKLQNKLNQVKTKCKKIRDKYDEIMIEIFKYNKIKSENKIYENIHNNIKDELNNIYQKINNFNIIEFNDIKKYEIELTQLTSSKDKIQSNILLIENKLNIIKLEKERINKYNLKNSDLENQIKYLDIYKQFTAYNGYTLYIIRKKIPDFEANINRILVNMVNFKISINLNKKENELQLYKIYNDITYNLEHISGFEIFITSVAIRIALIKFGNITRSNFFILDEGFGTMDQKYLKKIDRIYDNLNELFDFVLLITHIDELKSSIMRQIIVTEDKNNKLIFK